jgi:hypothetical protein
MEVRIGVVYTPRELVLEMDADQDPDQLAAAAEEALAASKPVFWLTDGKGRKVGVPTDKIAYIEISGAGADRKVGFGSR